MTASITRDDLVAAPFLVDSIGRTFSYPSTSDRFARNLKVMPSGCIEWQGSRSAKGYGRIRHAGRVRLAHRVAYALAHGETPGELLVLHSCDNPPCCNPDHLRLGTAADNSADMVERDRSPRQFDEANVRTKLSADDVVAIRTAAAAGQAFKALSREWHVHPVTISRICRGLRRAEA